MIEILVIEEDLPFVGHTVDKIIHPVKGAQERALATTGRSNDGSDLSLVYWQ